MPKGEKTRSLWKNRIYRKHMSEAHIGNFSYNKGVPITNIQLKEKIVKNLLKGGWNKDKKMSESFRAKMRNKFENEKWAKALFKKIEFKPNNHELYLDALLQLNFPNEWKYVGDGQVWIVGRNPDFINCDGKKLLIEYNGFYTHTKKGDESKAQHYAQYGFKTLNLYPKDLTKEVLLVEKIKGFING